jgi:sugar phosphate isomerase/epimerase
MKDNLTTNASNEAENPAFLVGAVICRFSQLPRKGLLADFSQIGLEQLVEFRTNDFYDLTIFEMQLEHIKSRAKELNAQFVVYHMGSNNISMSDNYMMKFTQNGL